VSGGDWREDERTVDTILSDTHKFRLGRLIAQRNAYREQRDRLADAIGNHRAGHAEEANEADSELWSAYRSVMRQKPDLSIRPARP
jgi:hypothetical protein